MSNLNGKTAFVTGASKGIGLAIAAAFAREGATVYMSARSDASISKAVEPLIDEGLMVKPIVCDVADQKAMESAFQQIQSASGGLDILVNNAGIVDPISRLEDSDPAAWGSVIDINTKGVYYGLRYAIPMMKASGGGTIITISSGAATGALEGWSHYCASKAAALSLTRCADKEVGDEGIRVVGLSPGTVATDMQVSIKDSGINPVSQLDWSSHIPPEYVAKAALALCGPLADEWRGRDFSLKTNEGRAAVGLPPLG